MAEKPNTVSRAPFFLAVICVKFKIFLIEKLFVFVAHCELELKQCRVFGSVGDPDP